VANVDDMSRGRVELGIGAGWFEAEHTAYGIPFPPLGERFDRLSEQLDVITGLWATADGATFDYSGDHYRLTDSPALPKPHQPSGPPIVIGGRGARRTPALTAAHATEFNMPFCDLETFTTQVTNVRRACEAIGRNPSTLRISCALVVCVGDDEASFAKRAQAIGREPEELRVNGVAGTPAEAASVVDRWREAGAERVYLQVLDLSDLEHLDLIAGEVLAG
jgi:alkanesulfonate monooxygenase SsuD/methylene tetrahydromethanopterin reductase-like flavin-dependent oxidoreductase (luciferase family)